MTNPEERMANRGHGGDGGATFAGATMREILVRHSPFLLRGFSFGIIP